MPLIRAVCVSVIVLSAQGCLATSVVLHVRPDGSGSATITTRLYQSSLRAQMAILAAGSPSEQPLPPLDVLMPAPDESVMDRLFGTDVRVVSSRLEAAADGDVRTSVVDFDDIRNIEMMFPPLVLDIADPHGAGLGFFNGAEQLPVIMFSIQPAANGARRLVLTLPNSKVSPWNENPLSFPMFQQYLAQERLFKEAVKHMSLRLSVELEQPLLGTNAPRRDGNGATIIDLDLDRILNAIDETRARRLMAVESYEERLWRLGELPGAIVPKEGRLFLEYSGKAHRDPTKSNAKTRGGSPRTVTMRSLDLRVEGFDSIPSRLNSSRTPSRH